MIDLSPCVHNLCRMYVVSVAQVVYNRMVMKKSSSFDGPFEAHAMGGRATAAKLTPEQRSARARKAVLARYAKAKLKKAA